jgi:hypothetical protein
MLARIARRGFHDGVERENCTKAIRQSGFAPDMRVGNPDRE